ncbi:triose-phosphate isomerase [Oscillatoria amoena NRMC-F 0135]|nr:triose-phosphate isomerase [Oscillatoria amoena NRMC-F 0135]
MRKTIIAGNWKMNKTAEEAQGLVSEIVNIHRDEINNGAEVVIIPPFVHLSGTYSLIKNSAVKLGAQNCSEHESGAYTGEISAGMLVSYNASYVIIGHSERRQYFGETNALLAKKVDIALKHNLTPIYCCGETIEQRNAGEHFNVNETQITEGLFHLNADEMKNVVIAYEPVWAIGTGVTASSAQAQEVHAFIRSTIAKKYGNEVAQSITIQYGGSMKPENAAELLAQPDIDGGLIGGAALKSRDFIEIIKAAR